MKTEHGIIEALDCLGRLKVTVKQYNHVSHYLEKINDQIDKEIIQLNEDLEKIQDNK